MQRNIEIPELEPLTKYIEFSGGNFILHPINYTSITHASLLAKLLSNESTQVVLGKSKSYSTKCDNCFMLVKDLE